MKQLWLHREPAAQPIVTVGYRDKIPPMQTPTRGLVLANTTQIFPEDRGTNYAVREGATRRPRRMLSVAALTKSSVCPLENREGPADTWEHDLPGLQLALPSSWSEQASG